MVATFEKHFSPRQWEKVRFLFCYQICKLRKRKKTPPAEEILHLVLSDLKRRIIRASMQNGEEAEALIEIGRGIVLNQAEALEYAGSESAKVV